VALLKQIVEKNELFYSRFSVRDVNCSNCSEQPRMTPKQFRCLYCARFVKSDVLICSECSNKAWHEEFQNIMSGWL